jgi:hypothetical protein
MAETAATAMSSHAEGDEVAASWSTVLQDPMRAGQTDGWAGDP